MKILIVDDDHINTTVLRTLLAKEGHDIVTASNGLAGVEAFRQGLFDLVLLDIMMPFMNGYEAARHIKESAGDRFVPIIFLTAITEDEGLAKCIDAGGDDFLTKPFNRVILKAKIDAMARIRQLHTVLRDQKGQLERHQASLEHEMEVGKHLFTNIVAAGNLLDTPCLKHWLSPMSIFNGDLLVAADNPTGGLHVMLGDFTGHGLSAAVGAMPMSEIFYAMTAQGFSISDIVEEINVKLVKVLPTRMFCATCFINIDPRQKSLSVWNGGLPDVLIIDGEGRIARRIPSSHLPLGIAPLPREERKVEIIEMNRDHRLLLFSDGLIEAYDEEEEHYGQDRLERLFDGNTEPEMLFQLVLDDLERFRGRAKQNDDISLLEIVCARAGESQCGDSRRLRKETIPPSRWQFSLELSADTLKSVDPLPIIINAVMKIQAPAGHRERLHIILSELFSNALDHGLLNLDTRIKMTPEGFLRYYAEREERLSNLSDGFIRLELSHAPSPHGGELVVQMTDSGPGFNHLDCRSSLEGNMSHGGRGIALIRSLCSELSFHGTGNIARVVYRWDDSP